MLQWMKESITGRLARAYIHEVGAAAVDLYSGELRRGGDASVRPETQKKDGGPAIRD
jgi:hypothetical protein